MLMHDNFHSENAPRHGGCELDCGSGLHFLRVHADPERESRRSYASELAILLLIPHGGTIFLELDDGRSATTASGCSTWLVNLERGASLIGAGGAKYSALKIALSALECLATGCEVRITSFPMISEYPPDTVLEHLMDALCEHVFASLPGRGSNAEFCHAIGTAIQYHILRTYGDRSATRTEVAGTLAPWQLQSVKQAMLTRLDSKVDARELAEMCGISTSHLRRAFFASTGQSLHRWVVRQRIDQACGDLLATSLPTAEIALRWGFSDQSHLTRTFAAILGMTPARWKRAHSTMAPVSADQPMAS
ncbi:helix-turn-helix domain-containing protein [Dyella sp. Tek66A03]|uniref:helix-turn-helix domain-containing protein n=1 Tax=Dyella sp. Tek66A03 TaxID=3458298 RepID=UPI00403E5130